MLERWTKELSSSEWEKRSLAEICDLISRGTAPSYTEISNIRVIGQRCVQNSGFDAQLARFQDSRATRTLKAQVGDVLLNSTGTGTIGRSCIFKEYGEFIVDSHITVIRTKKDQADPRWVNEVLRSPRGKRHLESHCFTGSTNQIELSRSQLAATRIPLPPIGKQREIADTLNSASSQLEATERIIQKLISIGVGIISNEIKHILTTIPSREIRPLETVAEISSGVTLGSEPSGPGTIELPYMRVANVQDGYIDTKEIKTVRIMRSELPRYLLSPGDVLLTEGGDFDKLGRGAVWDGRIPRCLSQNHIFRVRCNSTWILPEFLAAYVSSYYGKRYFLSMAKQTTNLATINSKQLKAMPVPTPSIDLQRRVVDALDAHRKRIEDERNFLNKLILARQGLADDLISGHKRCQAD